MDEKFLELLKKKASEQGGKLEGPSKDARLDVLGELKGMMGDNMAKSFKNPEQSVTVEGDSPESVEEGLDLAKEMMGEEDPESVAMGDEEELLAKCEHKSPEEIDMLIQKLEELKEEKKEDPSLDESDLEDY